MEGKTYIWIQRDTTWVDARAACKSLSGNNNIDLATIPTYKEFDQIIPQVPKCVGASSADETWIGLKMEGSDYKNEWYWITGEPVNSHYAKWGSNEPQENEPCGLIRHNGEMGDYYCDSSNLCSFLCKVF